MRCRRRCRGRHAAGRVPIDDRPSMSPLPRACASVGCRGVSLLAEPAPHASSPIHTKGIPTISLCRRLRCCSSEKQVSRSCSPARFICPTDLASLLRTHAHPSILSASHHGTYGRCGPQAPSTTAPAPWRHRPFPASRSTARLRLFKPLMQGSHPYGITYKSLANSSGGTSVRRGTFKTRPVPWRSTRASPQLQEDILWLIPAAKRPRRKAGINQAFGEATGCWLMSGRHLASGLEPWF